MEDTHREPTKKPSEAPITQKRPYEAPKATVVPLKLEERLLACSKAHLVCAPGKAS